MKYVQLCLLLSWSTFIVAQEDIAFTVSLSSDTVNLEQPFEVTFTINAKDASNFERPAFDGFELAYGPNQSTQMSIINGDMTQKRSYTFGLQALEEGTFVLSPASITINGTVIKTDFTKIVVDSNYVPKSRKRGGDSFFDQFRMDFSFPDLEDMRMPRRRKRDDSKKDEPAQKNKKSKKKRKVYKI